ncbi:MAG: glycosyltransferase family 4 protein [Candidatus Methylomirabilales bacterium]
MARLKIAIVALDFNREGGSEGRTGHLVDRLIADGHEVHLLGARIHDAWHPAVVRRQIPTPANPHWLEVLLFSRRAGALVRREAFDIVHSQIRPFVPGIVTVGGGCHRYYLREVFPAEKSGIGRLKAWFPLHLVILWLERRNFRPARCPYIIANSGLGRDGILRHYPFPPERIIVAHNGVDPARFSPAQRQRWRAQRRRELGAAPNQMLALFVGTGFHRKGLAPLLEALRRLPRGTVRLAVVGGGASEDWKRRAADLGLADLVTFTGRVRDAETYYAAADLFVLPTRFDPFANATLEAMASGLPVITSRQNGAAEILTAGQEGVLVEDPADAGALAGAIALLRDPARRAAMGARARETAMKYTWDGPLHKTLEVYAKVRAESRAPSAGEPRGRRGAEAQGRGERGGVA